MVRQRPWTQSGQKILAYWWLLLALSGWLVPALAAAAPAAGGTNPDLPLQINAAQLEVDHARQEIIFKDQVVARYKDVILYTELLKIHYQPKPAEGKKDSPLEAVGIEKIDRIEAVGQVRLVQEDRVATGDRAVYYPEAEKIVLSGNPQLWRGQNSIRGDEVVVFIKENRVVVRGRPSQRVEAVLYPATRTDLRRGDRPVRP